MCIGSGDESFVMLEDEFCCIFLFISFFQFSDEDLMLILVEFFIFNRNFKFVRVSFYSLMIYVLQQIKICLCIKLLGIDFYLIFNVNFVVFIGRLN